MSSEVKVNKIWPRASQTAYIELNSGEITIFPKLVVDSIESLTGSFVNIEGWSTDTYVFITGNQTINGIKTFGSIPILPAADPTTDNQAVRKKYVTDAIAELYPLPTGGIIPFAGTAANIPAGFLLCDATLHSTTTYSDLFALLGYTYGGSAASFGVPNLKGRVIVGLDAGITDFNALAKIDGHITHTLGTAEMPAHTHTTLGAIFTWSSTTPPWTGNATQRHDAGPWVGSMALIADPITQSTGGGTAHNNLQPYMVLNYIIKT